MAKTLLLTQCYANPNGSFDQTNISYDSALRAAGKNPIVSEASTTAIGGTCTIFELLPGTELDRYCATDQNNQGVMRVETYTQNARYYDTTDTPDITCNGACNLYSSYASAYATSAPGAKDGKIVVSANSTKPPVTAYIAQLGSPTSSAPVTTIGANSYYEFTWTGVKPGTYAAQLQDNGNCQLTTPTATVLDGSAPGTGTPGLPSNVTWFKYEYINPAPSSFGQIHQGGVQGYAWDKVTKNYYKTQVIPLTFPYFNEQGLGYNIGEIVGWVRDGETIIRYYRALLYMSRSMFLSNSGKIPNPDENGLQQGWWERLHDGVHDNVQPLDIAYFDPNPRLGNSGIFYRNYEKGHVCRYGYNSFYETKDAINGYDYRAATIPKPDYQKSNRYWNYLPNYSFFHYVVPEVQVVDQYAYGVQVRRVRFHLDVPDFNDVPSTTDYLTTPDNDFVLFDDNTPTVEAQIGELKVIDIIKNDVDNQGQENGSVWVMAQSPAPPIRYHLRNGVRPGYIQDNNTGIYENLHPGDYVVDIYDSFQPTNRYVTAEFTITDDYKQRWKLIYDDYKKVKLETFIMERGFKGSVTEVCGTGQPAVLTWDTGGDPGGVLPESQGSTLQFNLLTQVAQQFAETAKSDDRMYRVDHYRDGKLQFRGYLDAQTYEEAMTTPAGNTVSLLASDGLGKLNNTKFINHLQERQVARTNQLSIILKILSYCDVNLPVYCGLNLRDKLMAADADPLDAAYVHRNAYNKKDGKVIADEDLPDARTILDAILRLYNAAIFQADGCWKIISYSEVYADFAVRAWSPAGSLLSGVDTSSKPVRILQSDFATADHEVFWIEAAQKRTTIAALQLEKATVDLQLEKSLFLNGDFVDWNVDVPTYWSKQGSFTLAKAKGEKAGESAVKFSGYDEVYNASNYLLSPPVPHLNGQQEDGMRLTMRAIVEPATVNPAEATVTLFIQLLTDGSPFGDPIEVSVSSKDKWKDFAFDLPFGYIADTVRVRVLEPVVTSPGVLSTVRINSLYLAIQPGLVDWSDQKSDFVFIENPVLTGIKAPDLELVHADLPLLPDSSGERTLAAKGMDVFAWRHAVSLADYSATTSWKRPAGVKGYPLLDNAAQDRVAMRNVAVTQVSGTVMGPGIKYLRQGLMLDMPQDVDGRFVVISCAKDERRGSAQITVRKLADGDFGGVAADIPDGVRIGFHLNRQGYRIGFKDADEGYRIGVV